MVNPPEFREGASLVWGRAPSRACPERSRRVNAERSSAVRCGQSNSGFAISGAARVVLLVLLVLAHPASWATGSPPAVQQPAESPSQFGTIAPYLGLAIDQIELPDVPPE